jgi:transposase
MKNVYDSVVGAGVDVHYKFSTVAMVNESGRVVRRERLDHPDRQALRGRLAQWPVGMTAVMEASFGWGWLSDLMEESGIDVRLANCFKVEKMRQARGQVKTNDKDAALLAPLPAESSNWWEVWRAPREVRTRREWMRHRMDLVGMQTAIKCRVHAIFHRHGIFHEFSDLFGGKGRQFLSDLCEGRDGQSHLLDDDGACSALRDNMEMLKELRRLLARIAVALRSELERSPQARCIQSVPGFGLILAHVVLAEIGDIKRFARSRSLANYSLLAPRCDDTGEADPGKTPIGRHLGQRGNRVLKWAFIEAAHGAVRHGGMWREMFNRVTDNGRRDRGRGYIKVARALVDVVYAVLRDQRMYQERRPHQPPDGLTADSDQACSDKADRKAVIRGKAVTRPGTGRLYHPMVAARA